MTIQIGVVTALSGEVTATAADGSSRALQLSDNTYANDLISTGPDGAIEIEFADGDLMDLGRSSQTMLDSRFFDPSVTTFIKVDDEAVLTLDVGNDFLINGDGDDILSGSGGDFYQAAPDMTITAVVDDIDDVVELADVLSNPDNQIAGVEHDGHLQIQVSSSEGVVQLINLTNVAAADDVSAQIALNHLLNSGAFDDSMS